MSWGRGADPVDQAHRRRHGADRRAGTAEEELPPTAAAPRHRHRRENSLLAWHGIPAPIARRLAAGRLEQTLPTVLRFGQLPLGADQAPLLLTGPPGAGKTLTIARLATRLVLNGIEPLVITADGRRAGAPEELAAYTRLLGPQPDRRRPAGDADARAAPPQPPARRC
ncbi:MAG: hypothetical protein WDN04_11925 [Rhodospirillales bacterium]